MKKFLDHDLFIFDVDGTLLDTSEGLINSTLYTINKLGLKKTDEQTLKSFVGPRIQDSMYSVYGLENEELKNACFIFRDHYKQGDVLLAKPYEGVFKLLDYLKANNKKMAVATNKRQDFVDALMEKYDLKKYFKSIYGTDFKGKLKKSDLIKLCIRDAGDVKYPVMIGDSEYDYEAATETGIDFIGVTYGFGFEKSYKINSKNQKIIDSLEDLYENND
jgi:phosphoglycolate phosphatase